MRKTIKITVVMATVMTVGMALMGCGKKFECTSCGDKVSVAYGTPFDEEEVLCEECADKYYLGLNHDGYRLR